MNMWKNITNFVSTHTERIVVILAVILSVASFAYYYHAGLITAYGDSRGHLDIARRVVDSLTPGAAQLGGYWLPLLHVLMLPTIWNDFMWQSGLSGSIPNMIAFVVAVLYMYRLALLATGNKFSAFIGASVLLFNPNLLYMQATPMTESLFVCTITVFMFYFYRWFQEEQTPDLVLAAIFLVLSSLNRYEGWGLVIAANVLMIWRWAEQKFDKKMEGAMIAFGLLSFFGIFLWLLWGAVIFHDPLEFMHNAWLTTSLQSTTSDSPRWLGDGSAFNAAIVTSHAFALVGGYILFALALLAISLYFVKNFRSFIKSSFFVPLLLFVPFFFDVLTVYSGKIPITVPEGFNQYSGVIFNVRYALFSLPIVGFLISKLGRTNPLRYFLISIVLLNGLFLIKLTNGEALVLHDISVDKSVGEKNGDVDWFRRNYDGGLVMVSAGGNDSFMFQLGLPQRVFIHEGAYRYWEQSLKNPSKYADWIIMSKNNSKDSIILGINREVLETKFNLKRESNNFMIFKKIEGN